MNHKFKEYLSVDYFTRILKKILAIINIRSIRELLNILFTPCLMIENKFFIIYRNFFFSLIFLKW